MEFIVTQLSNRYVFIYVVLVVVIQYLYFRAQRLKQARIEEKRRLAGLSGPTLVKQRVKLDELRAQSKGVLSALLLPVFVLPLLLSGIDYALLFFESYPDNSWLDIFNGWPVQGYISGNGLLFTFLALMVWLLFVGSDIMRSAIGGMTFKAVTVMTDTMQLGDRVVLNGVGGKLVDIGIFYVTLQTLDDDKVCLATKSLWGCTLLNSNDGERSSLISIPFYLSPSVSAEQMQQAEDAIWDSVQASSYFEPAKARQIYYEQHPSYIQLTVKAYAASTYEEPLFKSEISQRFLQFAKSKGIPLAHQSHNLDVNMLPGQCGNQ